MGRKMHPYTKQNLPISEIKIYGILGILSLGISILCGSFFKKQFLINSVSPLLVFSILKYIADRILHKYFGIDISGDYDVVFGSSYTKFQEKKSAKVQIKQNFSKMIITWQVPDSSESYSINASLEKLPDGRVKLIYTYYNEPTIGSTKCQTQNIHYGTTFLEVKDNKLKGKYFTSERPDLNSDIQQTNWGIIEGNKIVSPK